MGRILTLDACVNPDVVGHLGSHLAKIKRNGLRVVDGFVIPARESLIDGLSNEILRAFDRNDFEYVILRASTNSKSFDNETIRNVTRHNLIDTIQYMQRNSWRRGDPAAIIVQDDLDAEIAGTIHSINPFTGDPDEILIESNLWMNDTVLTGESDPDLLLINKNNGAMSLEGEDNDDVYLTAEQISQLHNLVQKIEKHVGAPVSVDWAYNDNILYVLRIRPITDETFARFNR